MCDTVFSCASKLNLIVFLQRWLFQGPKKHFFSEQKQNTHQRRKKIIQPQATWISTLSEVRILRHDSVDLASGDVQKTGERFK